jgi:hypothetical protein
MSRVPEERTMLWMWKAWSSGNKLPRQTTIDKQTTNLCLHMEIDAPCPKEDEWKRALGSCPSPHHANG